MTTFLDCWIGAASTLLTQALAGEGEFSESLPKPFDAGSFGLAATIAGEEEGRFAVVLDARILETPLLGEGLDQKAAWGELLREVVESAAGELLAKTGKKVSVAAVEETAGEGKISRAFQIKTAAGVWTLLVRDEVRPAKKPAEAPTAEPETKQTSEPEAKQAGKPEAKSAAKSAEAKSEAKSESGGKASAERPGSGLGQGVPPGIDLLLDVELEATLRFGSREIPLGELLELGPGDVVQLDRHIADPVDLIVADKIVARGDVVLVNGNFGLRVTEVAEPRLRLETIRCLF
jgi:flagellar motor switch protein FliN